MIQKIQEPKDLRLQESFDISIPFHLKGPTKNSVQIYIRTILLEKSDCEPADRYRPL